MQEQIHLLDISKPTAVTGRGLDRDRLLGNILDLNPTAQREFLDRFSDQSLRRYLNHLSLTHGPRGGVWVRESKSPAIVQRENPD